MLIRSLFFIFSLLFICFVPIQSSDNGPKWKCDETILADDNQCIFVRSDSSEVSGPHILDSSCATNKKAINSDDGNYVGLSGSPFDNCDTQVCCSTTLTGNDLTWIKVWEMLIPMYDYAMFAPGDLSNWDTVTQMLSDCEIKETSYLSGAPNENYYSRADIKTLMEDPNNVDIKNDVLKFLEEAQNELVCIAMDTGTWDSMGHCDSFREARNLAEGEASDCWVAYYDSMETYSPNYNSNVDVDACSVASVNCDASSGGGGGGGTDSNTGMIIGIVVAVVVLGVLGICIVKCKRKKGAEKETAKKENYADKEEVAK